MIVNTLLLQAFICPPHPLLLHIYQRFSISLGVNREISILTSWAHTVRSSLLFSLNSPHASGSSTLHPHCPSQFLGHACSPCHRPSMDCVLGKIITSSFCLLDPTHPSPTISQGNPQWLASTQPYMYLKPFLTFFQPFPLL